MKKPLNPPAFPTTGEEFVNNSDQFTTKGIFGGMTLRDYFAAKAMQGIVSRAEQKGDYLSIAGWAYEYADAMLSEREKPL